MAASFEGSPSANPPLVYQSPEGGDLWIVEQRSERLEERALTTFTGPNALTMALRFAYEEFGSARFFPFQARSGQPRSGELRAD